MRLTSDVELERAVDAVDECWKQRKWLVGQQSVLTKLEVTIRKGGGYIFYTYLAS